MITMLAWLPGRRGTVGEPALGGKRLPRPQRTAHAAARRDRRAMKVAMAPCSCTHVRFAADPETTAERRTHRTYNVAAPNARYRRSYRVKASVEERSQLLAHSVDAASPLRERVKPEKRDKPNTSVPSHPGNTGTLRPIEQQLASSNKPGGNSYGGRVSTTFNGVEGRSGTSAEVLLHRDRQTSTKAGLELPLHDEVHAC